MQARQISLRQFVAKVRDAGKVGAFGRVVARGKFLSQHSTSDLSDLFDEIDEDGNGDLTAQEFLEGLEEIDSRKNMGKGSKSKRALPPPSSPGPRPDTTGGSVFSSSTVLTAGPDDRRPSSSAADGGGGRKQRLRSCMVR